MRRARWRQNPRKQVQLRRNFRSGLGISASRRSIATIAHAPVRLLHGASPRTSPSPFVRDAPDGSRHALATPRARQAMGRRRNPRDNRSGHHRSAGHRDHPRSLVATTAETESALRPTLPRTTRQARARSRKIYTFAARRPWQALRRLTEFIPPPPLSRGTVLEQPDVRHLGQTLTAPCGCAGNCPAQRGRGSGAWRRRGRGPRGGRARAPRRRQRRCTASCVVRRGASRCA